VLSVVGRLVEASNTTLLCELRGAAPEGAPAAEEAAPFAHCVYKPIRGERPLDDFPRGTLAYREVAAHEVSEAIGWRVVPPTVLRDGPYGPGMVQWWIDVDEEIDVLELILTRDPRLRRIALFDAVIENADRKGGHILAAPEGHLFGCDHGVCFSVDPKLRTVLWGWRGEVLDEDERSCLRLLRRQLDGPLGRRLAELLAPEEVAVTRSRVDRLLEHGRMPLPDPWRPAIPWPPF
jgi:hypothetical protein